MDETLDQVVKHCGPQLLAYNSCVHDNPKDWYTTCVQQRHALTQCSEEHVTLLKTVKQKCSAVITVYDRCVKEHDDTPDKCVQALLDLYRCTQNAAQKQE
ncbi:hypothetical protein IWQ60_006756 [Tieghemiomyces parasiticus]|uniref:IMS import disulfide relay-system CHCH-CHCH-like Cx9C domain-containing protein n=1 Tax=Tieghemiomyces parasiticus TaxID=78921 RepID=A0A9W7ZW56_9FUNG|nr:hypothetical protein IWQ60_008538 [Tieghemiomyces parasiticus]KAJ1921481.1 hypothetical protein IWQ60_006756 [Tieghemiomyces parasiticus]